MKRNICNRFTPSAARTAAVLPLLFVVGALIAPQNSFAQNIPPVGKPQMVGFPCPSPSCKRFIDTPSGKMPSSCRFCGFSFVQSSQPKIPQSFRPVGTQSTMQQPPDAHDDRLYYDGAVTAGSLRTRHFEADGLAARAEAWGKEMKQVDAKSRAQQAAQAQAFEKDKNALLNSQGNGTALQQLRNVFDDDAAWDSPSKGKGSSSANDPNVVDFRHLGEAPGTPDLLRKPDPKQPSEYDIPRDGSAPKLPAKETEGSISDFINLSTRARLNATKDATAALKPYQQEEVEKITAEGGWVIAARDLDSWVGRTAVNLKTGRDDNPYGMHWQILLPNGENAGYTAGTTTGQDGKVLPNIKSESGAQYKGIVASGKNGAAMTEAVQNVKDRWEEKYITDPEGQGYNAGAHNCQDFTGDVLREYQRLLSKER
jgi:hypothetical protein